MKSTIELFVSEQPSADARVAQSAAHSVPRAPRFAVRQLAAMLTRSALFLPTSSVALSLLAPLAFADSGPTCAASATGACQIIYNDSGTGVGHGDTGVTPAPITSTFTNAQTLTGVPGPSGWGAIQLETMASNGGAADSNGGNGGHGAMGSNVTATVGSAVTAQGSNGGGILRFTAQAGDGGPGQGDILGTPGVGGVGGGGGAIWLQMDGSVSSTDAGSPGLYVLSQGGTSLETSKGGSKGFYAPKSGNGGGSNQVSVTIGGQIDTVSTGASINGLAGAGGIGADDTGGYEETEGRDGGIGASSAFGVQATVTGSINSSGGDGIDVLAAGGAGGTGGNAGSVTLSTGSSAGGAGGAGGTAPSASLTISGQVSGALVGATVTSAGGVGGVGGSASSAGESGGGTGGAGGGGGSATLTLQGDAVIGGGALGASALSSGGDGGLGGSSQIANAVAASSNGGNGGAGGAAKVTVGDGSTSQSVKVTTSPGAAAIGVSAISLGGSGGAASPADSQNYALGGKGGTGGVAGSAGVTVATNGSVSTFGVDAPIGATSILPGVLVRSNGGVGGAGGNGDAGIGAAGGGAGKGGMGSTATAVIDGDVVTTGSFAYGVLAQSIGGQGAGGGDANSVFGSYGGAAANGGNGGPAYLMGQGGTVTTTGTGAMGMVAQSIGGGGGSGGNASAIGAGTSIGGNGGGGGDGQAVTAGLLSTDSTSGTLSDTIITRGDSATALLAQSVGGGGGNGGNAVAFSLVLPAISIGGDGKSGGIGGGVNVQNDGLITTQGQQSSGIAAQSVGGGGGNGGSAVAISVGVQVSTSFALGGNGANGGTGGVVNLTNNNQVSTYGADAYGVKAQSISGGGGQGGSALATAIALGGDPDVPTVSVSIALGGKGGAGGDQSNSPVNVTNNGLITTAGDGSIGVLAQNIAGGGGDGGDSTASSYSNGGDGATNVSASASVGGSGGGGGTGGAATVNNNALIVTLGADAYGVMAQSVAGGGGTGGTGDSSASAAAGESSYSGAVTVGGTGKQGGQGGTVTVNNGLSGTPGNIATAGDGSHAIFAQSVGGGGGASGGGTSKANGGTLNAGVTVGGNAGNGGNGGSVQVTNQSLLLTQGADSDAIFAQSVGGGGGKAGKGSSTSGGAQKPADVVNQMSTTIANGLNLDPTQVTTVANGVYKVGNGVWNGIGKLSDLQSILGGGGGGGGGGAVSSLRDDDDDDGTATTLTLNATIGGQGGSGGAGGAVTVTNNGSIQTSGTRSDGIFAQSVGGGGGVGGASSFSTSSTSGGDGSTNGSLKVGGDGAGAGNAAAVTVTNTGAITTRAVTAYGISAQSIGGGGGKGGATAATSGALKNFNVTVGGSGGMGGNGDAVGVTNDGIVTTSERLAIGVLAQSVGGGGGTAHLLSSDVSVNTSGETPQVSATLGGSGGAAGTGSSVTVNLGQNAMGAVHTTGAGSAGIVAQSIGGGGGLIVATSAQTDAKGGGNGGGILDGTPIPIAIGGSNGASGSANTVNVTLGLNAAGASSNVTTNGIGAPAILAQSIGGGGGLFAGATPSTELAKLYPATNQVGNGGAVNVTLNNSGWIYTSGTASHGVFAQSIGGGGGVIGGVQNVDFTSPIQSTPSLQNGQGGNVTVNLQAGGNIWTSGARAHGIVAQAFGGGGGVVAGANNTGYVYAGATSYACTNTACTGDVNVTLGSGALVRTQGDGAYGIVAQNRGNGSNNATVTLAAGTTVQMWDQSAGGVYIDASGNTTVNNSGAITSIGGTVANPNAVAITNVHGTAQVENTGLIQGGIDLTSSGATGGVHNARTGQLHAGALLAANQVRNDGTLEVGHPGAAGAATLLRGDLVQGAGGRIVIDSDAHAGKTDRLTVSGNATLAGHVELRTASLTRDTVQWMDVRGRFDGSQLQGAKQLLVNYALSTAATTASDGVAQQSVYVTPKVTFSSASAGLNANAQAVAAHLQANFEAGSQALAPAFASMVNGIQDASTYRAALATLGNESQQAVGTARLAASHAFVGRMNSCPTFDVPGDFTLRERECVWGRAIDNRGNAGGAEHVNYKFDSQSLQFGGQRRIADGWFLGGSVAFDDSSFNSARNISHVSGRGTTLGVVLKREIGAWTLAGAADFNQGSYDSTRNIAFPGYSAQAKGSFDARQVGLHGRVAYTIPQDGWYLKPYVDLHAVRVRTDGYSEQGAGTLGLAVRSASDTMLSASPMLEAGGRWDLNNGMTLRPYMALGAVLHDKNGWGAQSQMLGAVPGTETFVANTSAPTRLAKLNLGLEVELTQRMQLRVEYGGQFGSHYRSHEGMLRANYKF